MQRLIFGLLAVALLGAGATVLLVNRYIDGRVERTTATSGEENAPVMMVLVAKSNLPIGKKIDRSDLNWQPWPKSGVDGDFMSAPKADNKKMRGYIGTITRRGIIKGTPITENAIFRSKKPGFLAGALDPNMRAVAVAISPQSGAAGFILPGDRVDVILTQNAQKKTRRQKSRGFNIPKVFLSHVAETILQNVRVLAADQQVDDFEKKAKVAKTVTLEVTRKQAEKLAVAALMGKLSLALRSLSDQTTEKAVEIARKKAKEEADRTAKGPTTTTDLEVSPLLAATAASALVEQLGQTASGPPANNSKQASGGRQIRVYRGGQPSTVKF